ncbi:tetratricopeptide repeat protein, partial [Thermoactinomyces daqus]
ATLCVGVPVSKGVPSTFYLKCGLKCLDFWGSLRVPLSYNILANVAYVRNELTSALELIEQAIDLFDREGERQEQYYVFLMNKVSYLEKLDRLEEGETIIEEVITNSHKLIKAKNRANSYELYAKVMFKKSPRKALEIATHGLFIASENFLPERVIELRTLLGDIYKKLGKLDDAKIEYEEALSLFDHVQTKSLFVSAYTSLGYLQLKSGELEQAKYSFSQAVKIGKEKEDSRYLDALIGLAQWYITVGRSNEAIPSLKKALEIAQHQGNKHKQLKIILKLTQCYQSDRGQFFNYLESLQRNLLELEDENDF